ncbi:MAG: lipopolysaccharide biosynthesis protein [Deltaproteobacteria bacterium]|nr:lipopolysaccharide biosynthesis protein [Deltaproteobacteria bacterium]
MTGGRYQLELPRTGDVERRAAQGVLVTAGAQIARVLTDVAGTMLLARLLLPADFGLVDMIIAVTGLIDLLKDFGLSSATIQREKLEHEQVNALFWTNVGLGVALTLATLAAAPLIAAGYGRQELLTLGLALAPSTLLGSLSIQHSALLKRNLQFTSLARNEVLASLLSTTCAVSAAFAGWGVWALVVRRLCRLTAVAALAWLSCGWRPSILRRARVRELLVFGGHLSGFQVASYVERNLDNVLVGRFAGAQALGHYTKAYEFLRLPLDQIMSPVGSIALPMLSRLQASPERYRRAYVATTRLLLLVTAPLAPVLVLGAEWIIPALLGPQWTGVIPVFQAMGVALLTKPLASTSGWLFISQGRTAELLRWGLLGTAIAVTSFVVGLPWGAVGVAVAYTVSDMVIRVPILFHWVGRRGPVRTRDLLYCLGPGWLCAGTIAASHLALARTPLSTSLGPVAVSLTSAGLGAALTLALPFGRTAIKDGLAMLRGRVVAE